MAKRAFIKQFGTINSINGLVLTATGLPDSVIGSHLTIVDHSGQRHAAEVVGYVGREVQLMLYSDVQGIGPGARVYVETQENTILLHDGLLGRVINALGAPVDGLPLDLTGGMPMSLKAAPFPAHQRAAVGDKLDLGVRAINTFIPICKGQRMGIFAGSGVGKSVLMGMVATYSDADINIIGLIGERGREVNEFIRDSLGAEGLKRSVIVVATGDEPALMRRRAAYLTMTLAEYFRDQGKNVMLMMDSITRFAMAQREIGLSTGEPPTTRGFTPSVFSELPKLLERAGPGAVDQGTITGIFTVLVEGGDMDEPVADAVRGIVDGHILMDRTLAERGHFPAIDILKSVSRMLPDCHTPEQQQVMNDARALIADYTDMAELIRLGAYAKGSDAKIDKAIAYHEVLNQFLTQQPAEHTSAADGFALLNKTLTTPRR